jgi:hypothetical protein
MSFLSSNRKFNLAVGVGIFALLLAIDRYGIHLSPHQIAYASIAIGFGSALLRKWYSSGFI